MPDQLTLRLSRTPGPDQTRAGFEDVAVSVDPATDTVLDAIVRAGIDDPTLVYRHACHHASCGTCAVRVDGRERLACITMLDDVWDGRSALTIEPLRNVPVIADLAVDPAGRVDPLAALRFPYVRTVEAGVRQAAGPVDGDADIGAAERFEDCIECFACVSACPVAAGSPEYLGPAVLAAAQRIVEEPRHDDVRHVLDLVDTDNGVWQCRSVWACSAVCPSGVDPATRIMDLRRRLLTARHDAVAVAARHDAVGVGA